MGSSNLVDLVLDFGKTTSDLGELGANIREDQESGVLKDKHLGSWLVGDTLIETSAKPAPKLVSQLVLAEQMGCQKLVPTSALFLRGRNGW